jgi:hypothetical protein
MDEPSRERTAHSGRIGATPSAAISAPVNTASINFPSKNAGFFTRN